jgi:hypothetical protein
LVIGFDKRCKKLLCGQKSFFVDKTKKINHTINDYLNAKKFNLNDKLNSPRSNSIFLNFTGQDYKTILQKTQYPFQKKKKNCNYSVA